MGAMKKTCSRNRRSNGRGKNKQNESILGEEKPAPD
jgi:hypothetical protein